VLKKIGWKAGVLAGCVFAVAAGAATLALSETDARGFVRLSGPDEVKWEPYPGEPGKLGVKQAYLYGAPSKPGLYVIRLKFPPHVMSRPHSHPDDRIAVVLQGTWYTGFGSTFDPPSTKPVHVGGYMMHPKGEMHYDGAKDEEVILQMVGMGPSGKTPAHPDQPDFSKQ
jgi:hypothetical protein